MTRISTILPCFNAGIYLREALESVRAQGFVGLEIIVVDDGSTDSSASIVDAEFPDVRLIRTDNHVPSHARNAGVTAGTGSYLQFLDADDVLGNDKTVRQWAIVEQTGADVVFGAWQQLREETAGGFQKGERCTPNLDGDILSKLLDMEHFCPIGSTLSRRSSFEAVGGFREDLRSGEDSNFHVRLAASGARFVRDPSPEPAMYYRRFARRASLSTRNRAATLFSALETAAIVESTWRASSEGLTPERRTRLVANYAVIGRAGFES